VLIPVLQLTTLFSLRNWRSVPRIICRNRSRIRKKEGASRSHGRSVCGYA